MSYQEPTGFIEDGYTRKGYIDAIKTVHPAVRFVFRPMMVEEIAIVRGKVSPADVKPERKEQIVAGKLAEKIQSWDFKDGKGQPVPITAKNVLCMEDSLYLRLVDIVFGRSVSDVDPQWSEVEAADTEAILESALSDQKN